jgi:hypothetical protein
MQNNDITTRAFWDEKTTISIEEQQINKIKIMMAAQIPYTPKFHLFPTKRESKSYIYKDNRPS